MAQFIKNNDLDGYVQFISHLPDETTADIEEIANELTELFHLSENNQKATIAKFMNLPNVSQTLVEILEESLYQGDSQEVYDWFEANYM